MADNEANKLKWWMLGTLASVLTGVIYIASNNNTADMRLMRAEAVQQASTCASDSSRQNDRLQEIETSKRFTDAQLAETRGWLEGMRTAVQQIKVEQERQSGNTAVMVVKLEAALLEFRKQKNP